MDPRNRKYLVVCTWILLLLTAPRVLCATTFLVTTTNDAGPGTLREAIINANSNAGLDTIQFNLPANTHTIIPTSGLPIITDPVMVDGTSQPGFAGTPLVELNGQAAGGGIHGLRISAGFSTVRGLVVNRFGGAGIEISTNGNNVIEGNIIGLDPSGLLSRANGSHGILINNSPSNIVGGATAARNIISGNAGSGVHIIFSNATRNLVYGNYIGVDITGQRSVGNMTRGVFLGRVSENFVGSGAAEHRNVISGNGGHGISVDSGTSPATFSNYIRGNFIGTAADGVSALGNAGDGVNLGAIAYGNQIGGGATNLANRIMFNGGDGVYIGTLTNNLIRGNLVYGNGQLGIDLGPDGVTPNDLSDPDGGPNLLQNFPVLIAVSNSLEGTRVWGTLNSRPNGAYKVDVYVNDYCDPSGYGEGKGYFGSIDVNTDSTGVSDFLAAFATTNLPGRIFTALATDSAGNTSEFGPCRAAASTLPPMIYTVMNTNDSGPGSLRDAIVKANENINAGDRIYFDIPGAGPHTISPASSLPVITDATLIDGYTQSGATPNTLSNGFNAAIKIRLDGGQLINGLTVKGGEVSIRGLAITRYVGAGIELMGDAWACRIQGNFIAMGVGSGIYASKSPSHVIGGASPADRNVIGSNTAHGIHLEGTNCYGIVVQGNFIGTDETGTLARPNKGCGFYYVGAGDNLIGGTEPGAGNLISGNGVHGIELNHDASRVTIQGNYIGTDVSGLLALPNARGDGVFISSGGFGTAVGNAVGGTAPGAPNIIAFNGRNGVYVGLGTNHAIRANAIRSNASLGIDIGQFGPGPANDSSDADAGVNDLQNHPVLQSATNQFGTALIRGTLNSRSGKDYEIDFFGNAVCDPSGQGEGATYLGTVSVITDGSGEVNFFAMLPLRNIGENWITATATDAFGNTSEFSPCIEVVAAEARLNVRIQNESFIVRWPNYVPVSFILQTTTNLAQGAWQPVNGSVIDSDGYKSYQVIPDPSEPTRFYRLRE